MPRPPYRINPQYRFDVEAAGFGEEVESLALLVYFSASISIQLGVAFHHDQTKEEVGVYESELTVFKTKTWQYYSNNGFDPIELLHLRTKGPILHHHFGHEWVMRQTVLCKHEHERLLISRL